MPAACGTSNSFHAHFARLSLDPRAAAAAGPLPLARACLQRPRYEATAPDANVCISPRYLSPHSAQGQSV
eukprot:14606725-Alexandrium_andersonii.AAC.1